MTGKIFADSSDVYQDQARVLFDYYKKAAEKIVSEEVELEGKIAEAEEQKAQAQKLRHTGYVMTIVFACLSGVSAVAGIFFYPVWLVAVAAVVFLIINIVKRVKGKKGMQQADDSITAFNQAKADIRREYKVNKMGLVYVPVASKVPFEGKSFIVDHTGSCPVTNFSLSILRQGEEFQKSLGELESRIEKVPVAESNESAEEVDTSGYSKSVQSVVMHDYMGSIDREVRNISYLLGDSDTVSVSLPVVQPESESDKFLSEYATSDKEFLKDKPIIKVFDTAGFDEKIAQFNKLGDMNKRLENKEKDTALSNTDYLKRLMKRLSESVTLVSKVKVNSTSRLVNYTNGIFSSVLKASYNQYSPALEAEEIERIREASFDYQDSVNDYKPFSLKQSSRVRYDLFGGAWVAEDNSRTNMPFGMNQIQEEVLMPVINNLMNETRVERLKIYNGIKDQKMHYLNEWNKDVEDAFRDNRKSAQDLIRGITEAYSEYNSAYQTYMSYKSTQDALKASGNLSDSEVQEGDNAAEQIAGFEMQAQKCNSVSEDFQSYMDRLQEDILEKSRQFEHIEYYEASLRDAQSRDEARSQDVSVLQNLTDRQKRLIPLGTYSAVYAKLPPEPSSEGKLQEDFSIDLKARAASLLDEIERGARAAEPPVTGDSDGERKEQTDRAVECCPQGQCIETAIMGSGAGDGDGAVQGSGAGNGEDVIASERSERGNLVSGQEIASLAAQEGEIGVTQESSSCNDEVKAEGGTDAGAQ